MKLTRNPVAMWADIESSGLSPVGDVILEIGFRLTDFKNPFHEYSRWTGLIYDEEIYPGVLEDVMQRQPAFVAEMHRRSGLWDDLDHGRQIGTTMTPQLATVRILTWLQGLPIAESKEPLFGSSVHFDRGFLDQWMPHVNGYFHYRNIDVSTIKGLAEKAKLPTEGKPTASLRHRPQQDIDDSINEYLYFRDKGVCP